ncbi:GntR family transcriptional regulator [Dongia deserti]|uniref:GntR family transcriptional regulator n=1 Tax=Dongia deserti TaxID=2268030 RepID=UPI000E65C3AE|nr:GntR family transcriptional regulator [Dongia deserti]
MRHLTLERSLTDRTYDAILDAICDGELAAGARINQDELAQKLNVSRQPVVQALALLKVQGFVRESGRRGVVVAPLDAGSVSHLYELRSALDGIACRGAALRGSTDARAWGPKLIAEGRAAVASGSVKRMIEADMRFHRFLYELSGNPIIAETALLHWQHVRRLMGGYLQHYRVRDTVWDEHDAILEAVMRGDAEQAEKLARRHAEGAAANFTALVAGDEKYESKPGKPAAKGRRCP